LLPFLLLQIAFKASLGFDCQEVIPDKSFAGFDIDSKDNTITFEECKMHCDNNPDCFYADFKPSAQKCWLKHGFSAMRDKIGQTLYVKGCSECYHVV